MNEKKARGQSGPEEMEQRERLIITQEAPSCHPAPDPLLEQAFSWSQAGHRVIFSLQRPDPSTGKYCKVPTERWKRDLPQDRPRTRQELTAARATRSNANALQVMRSDDQWTLDPENEEAYQRLVAEAEKRGIPLRDFPTMRTPGGGYQIPVKLNGYRPEVPAGTADLEILPPRRNPSMVYGPDRTWNVSDPWNLDLYLGLTPELYQVICTAVGRHPEGLRKKPGQPSKLPNKKPSLNIKEEHFLFYVQRQHLSLPLLTQTGLFQAATILGYNADSWVLNRAMQCLFHQPDDHPSAMWCQMPGNEERPPAIGYHDFHTGTSFLGIAALALAAFHLEPKHPEPNKTMSKGRLILFMRGLTALINGTDSEVREQRRTQLEDALNLMEADPQVRADIHRVALLAEIYNGATGNKREFALPCVHVAQFLGKKTKSGRPDKFYANRILNTLCVIGYLAKTTISGCRTSGKAFKTDIYLFSTIDSAVCRKMKGLTVEAVRKMNQVRAREIIGQRVNDIYRNTGHQARAVHGPEREASTADNEREPFDRPTCPSARPAVRPVCSTDQPAQAELSWDSALILQNVGKMLSGRVVEYLMQAGPPGDPACPPADAACLPPVSRTDRSDQADDRTWGVGEGEDDPMNYRRVDGEWIYDPGWWRKPRLKNPPGDPEDRPVCAGLADRLQPLAVTA